MTNTIKFYYNGLKVNGGKLQKAWAYISDQPGQPIGTIKVCARDYYRFSAEVADFFTVENNSDSQTDYFEKDSFKVLPDHPLYEAVKTALIDTKEAKHKAKADGKKAALGALLAKQADLKAKGLEVAKEYAAKYPLPLAALIAAKVKELHASPTKTVTFTVPAPAESSFADLYKTAPVEFNDADPSFADFYK